MFPDRFLAQLVQLTTYCSEHKIPFEAKGSLRVALGRLADSDLGFLDRYQLENQIIKSIGVADLTAVEYHGALHGTGNGHLSISIGRILDIVYARDWQHVTSDPKLLDLYQEKAKLYDGIGIVGVCNNYGNRLQGRADANLYLPGERLDEIGVREGPRAQTTQHQMKLDSFLAAVEAGEEPSVGGQTLLSTRSSYRRVVDAIQSYQDPKSISLLIQLLEDALSVEMVPELFRIIELSVVLQRGEISRHDAAMNYHGISYSITVSDRVVALL